MTSFGGQPGALQPTTASVRCWRVPQAPSCQSCVRHGYPGSSAMRKTAPTGAGGAAAGGALQLLGTPMPSSIPPKQFPCRGHRAVCAACGWPRARAHRPLLWWYKPCGAGLSHGVPGRAATVSARPERPDCWDRRAAQNWPLPNVPAEADVSLPQIWPLLAMVIVQRRYTNIHTRCLPAGLRRTCWSTGARCPHTAYGPSCSCARGTQHHHTPFGTI